jgi:ABC-type multidrug transport system, ATPase and permease components
MDKKFTSIFISHRISTITNCDNIIVMDEGKIVESGKHNDLIMKNGIYSKINEIQSKEYDVSNE